MDMMTSGGPYQHQPHCDSVFQFRLTYCLKIYMTILKILGCVCIWFLKINLFDGNITCLFVQASLNFNNLKS